MSIIIHGMDMPKDGRLLISIHSDGCVYRSVYDMGFEKVDCAKAEELPPHGRLIDADALIDNCMKEDGFLAEMLFRKVSNAPTIIEAEEEKE